MSVDDIIGAGTAGKALLESETPEDALGILGLEVGAVGADLLASGDQQEAQTIMGNGVLIADDAVDEITEYTGPSFTANGYSRILIEMIGELSAFTYIQFRANADDSASYADLGANTNTAVSADSAAVGTNTYARAGVGVAAGAFVCSIDFYPKTTGTFRMGTGRSGSGNDGALSTQYQRDFALVWADDATNMTFYTLNTAAATFTGRVRTWGFP
ncbi:MAG TPA: hypothetical protein VJV75_03725 [Candidatus Polarisedimenticolia bacterium]|nr:hypothetical protein [Candidatus Polarisedimenticolia bacterium]